VIIFGFVIVGYLLCLLMIRCVDLEKDQDKIVEALRNMMDCLQIHTEKIKDLERKNKDE
jgi:hypothetical protein